MTRSTRPRSWAWLMLGPALLLGGCAGWRPHKVQIDETAGLYDKAQITYRVDSARLNAWLSERPQPGPQLVNYQAPASPLLPERSLSTLEIKYPHPDKGAGYARVIVKVETLPEGAVSAMGPTSRWQRFWQATREELPGLKGPAWSQETWVLEITRAELDEILASLRQSGYFGETKAPAPTADLAAQVDGLKLRKHWDQMLDLDMLVVRARTQGKLVASIKPAGSEPLSPSAQAYQHVVAHEQVPPPASPLEPSPSMNDGVALETASTLYATDARIVRLPPTTH